MNICNKKIDYNNLFYKIIKQQKPYSERINKKDYASIGIPTDEFANNKPLAEYTYAVYNNKTLLGFIDFDNPNLINVVKLQVLYIYSEYRNLGLGKTIMRDFESFIKNTQPNKRYIELDTSDKELVNYYENLGYELKITYKKHRTIYGKLVDKFILLKDISK